MPDVTLRPNAAGTYTEWQIGAGASNWEAVDEETADGDTTYVTQAGATGVERDTYNHPASGIPAGSTIDQIEFFARARNTVAGGTFQILHRSGVTDTLSGLKSTSTAYGNFSDVRTTDPNTGVAWTIAGVDAAQPGARHANEVGDEIRVTQVWMVVTYTEAVAAAQSLSILKLKKRR